jgi:hypothetical protein
MRLGASGPFPISERTIPALKNATTRRIDACLKFLFDVSVIEKSATPTLTAMQRVSIVFD